MKSERRTEHVVRKNIVKLLSDDEVSLLSTGEGAAQLSEGDEYVDLEHLEEGVRLAQGSAMLMGRVLPRKAVRDNTWIKILTQLPAPRVTARQH